MARQTRMISSMSTRRPYEHSTATALLWPIICMYVWPQQPEPSSLICLLIPLVPGQSCARSSRPTHRQRLTGPGITGSSLGSSSRTENRCENTSNAFAE
ncbi:hypothetical protein PR202_gb27310 [Eleusine coracana subsp. coracana]|uniref:Uncharacterized protein n=1 Tax=Eleusine coracana subsp. coracana TaxID=191504 RepID=A0AAV5FTE6_ELECO|nr:hypothetical protein PR202_gb27310 [Eleusine coracana subsp. coracana]